MPAFNLPPVRRGRRPGLTPMIDVVFLLLVFFMLASRFGVDNTLDLGVAGAGGGGSYSGPPRLVTILPDGLRLNGVPVAPAALPAALGPLMTAPDDLVVLRAREGASAQDIVDAMSLLTAAGFPALALVE